MREATKAGRYLRAAWEGMLGLLYPHAANCLCCGHPRLAAEEDCLCPTCREAVARLRVPAQACNRCLSPVKRNQRCAFCTSFAMRNIAAVYAPFRYAAQVRTLIHAFKFNACDEALATLAPAMADALTSRDYDCIVPVPLHPARLRARGVNQALLLARALGAETGIPVRELLLRTRFQRPQSRTALKNRRENVRGAFSCKAGAEGLRILLVDDVRTSGCTADACAAALLSRGARSVGLCVSAVVYRSGKKKKSAPAPLRFPF